MSSRRARTPSDSEGSYLSRWNRANTPQDSANRFSCTVQRSFTPVRDSSRRNSAQLELIDRQYRQRSPSPMRSPLSSPLHSNVNYYQEQQPLRKYDVFQLRTWSYPIWKYLHGRESGGTGSSSSSWQRSSGRAYGIQTHYTPPVMAAECRPYPGARGYSGYTYLAGEHSFDLSSRPQSLNSYQFWRSRVSTSPWYWNYYGHSGLRHFGSYRPRVYQSRVRTYWGSRD